MQRHYIADITAKTDKLRNKFSTFLTNLNKTASDQTPQGRFVKANSNFFDEIKNHITSNENDALFPWQHPSL